MKKKITALIIGSVILCFAGFYNKFPIMTHDSGAYINSGFTKEVPYDRPILYGLFIVHASWGKSLWLVIFSQGILISLLLYYYFKYFSNSSHYIIFYLMCLFFISFLMMASITISTIDPGIFMSSAILSMGLLLFANNLSKRDFVVTVIIMVVSMGMDISYILTLLIGTIVYALTSFIRRKNSTNYIVNKHKRFSIIAISILLGWLMISSIHCLYSGRFNVSKDLKISLVPRLIHNGLAAQCLEKEANYKLINHFCRDSLQNLVTKSNRFYHPFFSKEEAQLYHTLFNKALQIDSVHKVLAEESLHSFLQRIVNAQIDEEINHRDSLETVRSMFKCYNQDVREYFLSSQTGGSLKIKYPNYSQTLASIVSLVIFAIVLVRSKIYKTLFLFFLLFSIIYAFSSAILYGMSINVQYQALWLLPIPIFLYISKSTFIHHILNKIMMNS